MKKRILSLLACLLISSTAHAVVIIDNSTSGWYNDGLGDLAAMDGPGGWLLGAGISEGDPTATTTSDPGFSWTAAFGADWLAGDYSGGSWSAAPTPIPSTWAINTETAIVYDFSLATVSDLHIDMGVDNGIFVWLNGDFLFGATRAGGANINEYDLDLTGIAAGDHSLQILRADHGGATGYAISVDAEASRVSVSEPATLVLIAMGLLGLAFVRRNLS